MSKLGLEVNSQMFSFTNLQQDTGGGPWLDIQLHIRNPFAVDANAALFYQPSCFRHRRSEVLVREQLGQFHRDRRPLDRWYL